MIDFLSSMDNIPFLAALGLAVALAGVELVTLLLGAGSLGAIADSTPNLDVNIDTGLDVGGDVDLNMDTDLHPTAAGHAGLDAGTSLLTQSLAWLHLGKLPLIILLVLALVGFGLAGMIAQYITHSLLGHTLPWWLALVPALAGLILNLRFSGLLTVRYLPQDETQVVSGSFFIGKEATIVLGTATPGQPVQAKLRDPFGQTHYFMVEPRQGETTPLTQGMRILVISQEGSHYKAIAHPLLDDGDAKKTDPHPSTLSSGAMPSKENDSHV